MSKCAELANLIGNINAGGGGVGRNLLVNGNMSVSQRGTSFSSPAHAEKLLDQFRNGKSHDGAITVTQDSSGPNGFANSLKVDVTTADTSIGASQYQHIWTRIEAQNLQHLKFGTSDAQNVTLSFYVKSNKTGTYAVVLAQNDNSFKQATLTYTINSANTWERKSLTFNGDTNGVINDDTGSGLEINFILAIGSNYTSGSGGASFATYADANYAAGHAVNLLDSTSNEWLLTGVQLEVGQNETEFEHEPFERTLAKCQRYFHSIGGDGDYERFALGYHHDSTQARCLTFFPVAMRAVPTTTKADTLIVANRTSGYTVTSISVDYNNKTIAHIQYNVSSGLNVGEGCHIASYNNTTSRLNFDAEL